MAGALICQYETVFIQTDSGRVRLELGDPVPADAIQADVERLAGFGLLAEPAPEPEAPTATASKPTRTRG